MCFITSSEIIQLFSNSNPILLSLYQLFNICQTNFKSLISLFSSFDYDDKLLVKYHVIHKIIQAG